MTAYPRCEEAKQRVVKKTVATSLTRVTVFIKGWGSKFETEHMLEVYGNRDQQLLRSPITGGPMILLIQINPNGSEMATNALIDRILKELAYIFYANAGHMVEVYRNRD